MSRIEKGGFSIKFGEDARLGLLVERQIEKSGAILIRVRVPGAARDFSPRASFQCRLFYGVRTAPGCKHASTCVRTFKIKNCHPYNCSDSKTLHAPIGMGSAALAATLPFPGKATRISRKEQ